MKSDSPSSLELFLLALIDSGLTTPYEFHRQAGISVGASIPALNNLLGQKLVSKGKEGDRRRMEYSLTTRGRARLKTSLAETSEDASDLQSSLRLAILAEYLGSRAQAVSLLERFRSRVGISSESRIRPDFESAAETYRWMLSVLNRRRDKADLQALSEIVRILKQKRG